uniref:Late embryogenesis abundant protein LEA-2 subgroup domain-containing protein n=1 Tax=Ananas comosus var. bracteatus TaxID=296719 RepID=A0A6V7QQ88_ANACO
MADRVYPSGKPNTRPPQALNVGGGGGGGGGGAAAAFPATKSQMYQRPAYRPQAPKSRRRSGRSCCCSCVLWTLLALVGLVLLAAIAGGSSTCSTAPPPTFAVSSLRLSALNLSSSGDLLTSSLDVSVAVRNPNKKIAFLYDPISATASSASGGVDVGDGSFPEGGTLGLRIDLETKAGVKIGKVTTKKIGIRVRCEGIQVAAPKGKSSSSSSSAPAMDVACKVKLRIKIWKWTF